MNGVALRDELERTAVRWPLATAAKVDTFVKGRVAALAGVQSRRVLAAAQAELCNRALRRFFELLYDQTPGGRYANIGPAGRVRIAAPWSRRQYAAYGLTDHGSRILRSIFVHQLSARPPMRRPLEVEGGAWFVNLRKFPDLAAALAWLDQWPVSADLWLEHADSLPRRGRG